MGIINIAIVDDHQMVSKALESLISINEKLKVVMNCCNGAELIDKLNETAEEFFPDIILMDINMPQKNGIDTTKYISEKYTNIKVIALTMEDSEEIIIKMLRAGAKGYLLKDMSPEILFEAIDIVSNNGTFYTDAISQNLSKIKSEAIIIDKILKNLKSKELDFMKLCCTELTYKEIADQMNLSPRTIDGYRDIVFLKLKVKTRVGIVLFVLKNNLL